MGVRDAGPDGMKPFRTGLIVGKFCPLHKGHEYLIETAEASCDRLILISYANPGYPNCEAKKRRDWLSTLYPETIRLVVDESWIKARKAGEEFSDIPHDLEADHVHRHFTSWLFHKVLGEKIDAIFTSEDYGDGFARFASGYQSAPVQHFCVDKSREIIPISGTQIRQNPSQYRSFLSDVVWASFVKRAVFLGGESSGKTTLAQAVAERLNSAFTLEYGRELWEEKDGELVFADMQKIAEVQIEREHRLARQAKEWLFCDTSPLTTSFYSQSLFGAVSPVLEELSRRTYHQTFLCAPDFEFVQDGTRKSADFRDEQHAWYLKHLAARKVPFVLLEGSPEHRTQIVLSTLQDH